MHLHMGAFSLNFCSTVSGIILQLIEDTVKDVHI